MEKTRCSIELGNNRFVQASEWKDEIRIDVREWEIKDGKQIPTKKGISLPLHRWKMLVDSLEFLDQALDEKREYATHLGRNVYSIVKANGICVDLRQHWLPHNQTEVVPTKKGITLRRGEYAKFKNVASVICDFVPKLNSVVPCPYRSDHMNQLGFLSCPECNPDHFAEWLIDCDICYNAGLVNDIVYTVIFTCICGYILFSCVLKYV
jgi:hypothetical protein